MQSYITHLLNDLAAARKPEENDEFPRKQTMDEHFEEVERWLADDPAHTFSDYCGLQKEIFPPAVKLTDEQLQKVIQKFRQLLFSWNLGADLPDNLPAAKTYSLLITVLDKKTEIVKDGFITFEFCTYDSHNCPFDEFCRCKDFGC